MLDVKKFLINSFIEELEGEFYESFVSNNQEVLKTLKGVAEIALESISNSNTLYHNVEHTILVTSVGVQIMKGKRHLDGPISSKDWLHYISSLLCHDVGFVKGICRNDNGKVVSTGINDEIINLPYGSTDAALLPFHVDRGKKFVKEKLSASNYELLDINYLLSLIEMTRFPIPSADIYQETASFGGLVRAADLIGQLADPSYIIKLPALFYELKEAGSAEKLGYKNPEDIKNMYASFYWNIVEPYIQEAIKYLKVTPEGKQWVAYLHSHVFEVEHQKSHQMIHDINSVN